MSKHNVWITVEKSKNFSRKNAPEVAKVPQNEFEKMAQKPTWMERRLNNQAISKFED
jgi:hypothetical protein